MIFFIIISFVHRIESEEFLSPSVAREYQIKAAFIFNFIKLTTWPLSKDSDKKRPFRVFIVGGEGLGSCFEKINGIKYQERTVRVYFVKSLLDFPDGFDVLFITQKTDKFLMRKFLKQVKGLPVLTIGEEKDFIDTGGVANFFSAEKRLRFVINPHAARKHGLKMSSRLLKLALIEERGGSE